jgi:hypothetical protein
MLMSDHPQQSSALFAREGVDFANVEAVRHAVLRAIGEIMANDLATTGQVDLNRRVDIQDASGKIVLSIPFSDAATIARVDDRQTVEPSRPASGGAG